jgi:hypothetical protein
MEIFNTASAKKIRCELHHLFTYRGSEKDAGKFKMRSHSEGFNDMPHPK